MSRVVVFALLALLVVPLESAAQQRGKLPRIGVVGERGPKAAQIEAFRQGLRELGYTEGQNVSVEYRYIYGIRDQIPGVVGELIRLQIDVLVVGGTAAALAAKAQSATVPIVFTMVGDPVGSGLAQSLRRPGGNATGTTNPAPELGAKQLELLKDIVPRLTRVAVLYSPTPKLEALKRTRDAARMLAIEVREFEVRKRAEVASAFASLAAWRPDAVLVLSHPIFGNELVHLSTLAAVHRLPAIYLSKEFAEAGGLLTYGASLSDNYRRAATYVDKILKGARPADLPVEQPARFDLVINLNTAKAFGLVVPPTVLVRATEVIQ